MISRHVVQNSLENLVSFITPYLPLVNSHMVGFITEKHYQTFIPDPIQIEIINAPTYDTILNVFWQNTSLEDSKYPEIRKFLRSLDDLLKINLDNVCVGPDRLSTELQDLGFAQDTKNRLEINEFMTAKKKHEVELTSEIVTQLCSHSNNDNRLFIIDAGDGKGYLSSRLALEYNLKVLGIDANNLNSLNAKKRVERLSRAWNGLTRRADDISRGIQPPRRGKQKKTTPENYVTIPKIAINYKTTTEFITSKTDLCGLVSKSFPDVSVEKILLSGLHTCGNLAADCLKIFVENPQVDSLLNVGCCYHLLTEEFIEDTFYKDRKSYDKDDNELLYPRFPMSDFLRRKVSLIVILCRKFKLF